MPELCFSNELKSCDEGLHCDIACLLYSKLINKLLESRIIKIISSVVEIEIEFVVDALSVELIGINSMLMCYYIKCRADQLLLTLGCDLFFKVSNPFEWMETISLQGKKNSLKNASVNNRIQVLASIAPTKPLLFMQASDEKQKSYNKQKLYRSKSEITCLVKTH